MLTGKTIFLLSPQRWHHMLVSKHHYAKEFARMGNEVYFITPPDPALKGNDIRISQPLEDLPGLNVVKFGISFPYRLKFYAKGLFHRFMKGAIKRVRARIGVTPDVVWDFTNTGIFNNLNDWGAAVKVYHPVDQVNHQDANTKNAQVVFSVSEVILEVFDNSPIPKHFINHGLGGDFYQLAEKNIQSVQPHVASSPSKVGYIGNLLILVLDRPMFQHLVESQPQVEFHLWGRYDLSDWTLGGEEGQSVIDFVGFLKKAPNVILHGPKSPDKLVVEIEEIDAWLLCYDMDRDPNKGSNSHKILEYLSTGKAIIANHVSSYRDETVLEMLPPGTNDKLPELFEKVIAQLDHYNSPELQRQRIEFALDNSYPKQIQRMSDILEHIIPSRQMVK